MTADERVLFDIEAEDAEPCAGIIQEIEQRILEPTPSEVESAVSIMQRHLGKEARNRQVSMISPEDLCPAQKRDMVRDIARLFKS